MIQCRRQNRTASANAVSAISRRRSMPCRGRSFKVKERRARQNENDRNAEPARNPTSVNVAHDNSMGGLWPDGARTIMLAKMTANAPDTNNAYKEPTTAMSRKNAPIAPCSLG